MQAHGAVPQPEELLAHAGWIRQLARRLARDESSADDLVQETWIAALTRSRRRAGPLRPWLGRVLANTARQSARGEGRRRRREALVAAEHSPTPSSAELAQRLDLQQKLVEHVQALKEPYRSTVLLRYFEGLTAAEIARRSNAPAATVRSHLSRALDELRQRLDEDHAGRRTAWAGLYLPVAGSALAAGSGTTGIVGSTTALMKGLWLVKKLLAAAALALLALWTVLNIDGIPLAPTSKITIHAPAAVAAVDSAEDVAAAEELEVLEESDPGARTGVAAAKEPRADDPPFALTLAVVDSVGAPIPGASLRVDDGWVDVTESDEDGSLFATIESDGDVVRRRAEVWKAGYASAFLDLRIERDHLAELGQVELGAAGSIAGRVVDAGGHPIPGARVLAVSPADYDEAREIDRLRASDAWPERPWIATDESGAFVLPSVPIGFRRVRAEAPDRLYAYGDPIEVAAGVRTNGVELRLDVLPADVRIEGVVRAPDGRPLPDVSVRWWRDSAYGTGSSYVSTDENGRFRVLSVDAPIDLLAHDPKERWSGGFHAHAVPGTLDVVLQFEEPRSIELHVTDSAGHAIERFGITLIDAERERPLSDRGREGHPSGRTQFYEPAVPYRVDIDPEGAEIVAVGPFEPGATPGVLPITVEILPGIEGRVIASGAPLAGARVTLYRQLGDDELIELNGYKTRIDPRGTESGLTAADGTFHLTTRVAGDWSLRVDPPAGNRTCAATELPLEAFEPRNGRRIGDVILAAGGAIEGVVRVAFGSPAGSIVAVTRHDLHPRTQRVGTAGTFRFDDLIPGPWLVELVDEPFDTSHGTTTSTSTGQPAPPDYASNCVVYAGAVTPFDLRADALEPCRLHGSFWIDSEPVTAWTATLRPRHGGQRASERDTTTLDERGWFTLEVPSSSAQPAAYLLELATTDSARRVLVVVALELRPGDNDWSHELTTGRLNVTPRPGAGRVVFTAHTDAVSYEQVLELADELPVLLTALPAGAGHCSQARLLDGAEWDELVDEQVQIEPGQTARVDD